MVHYKYFVVNTIKGDGACIYYVLFYIYIYYIHTIHMWSFDKLTM